MFCNYSVSGWALDCYYFCDVEHPRIVKSTNLPKHPYVGASETRTHPPSMMGYGTTTLTKEPFC